MAHVKLGNIYRDRVLKIDTNCYFDLFPRKYGQKKTHRIIPSKGRKKRLQRHDLRLKLF